MKKIICLALVLATFASAHTQNLIQNGSFEQWTDDEAPLFWMGMATNIDSLDVLQSKESVSGEFSVNLIRSASRAKRFSTHSVSIKKDHVYEISFFVKGGGSIRTGLYDTVDYIYNTYIESTPDWTQQIQTIKAKTSTNLAEFFFSMTTDLDGLFVDSVEIIELNHDAEILAFSFDEEIAPSIISPETAQVTSTVRFGTDLQNMTPQIVVSDSATISPANNTDFSETVNYTVTAEDGTTKNWTVNVIAPEPEQLDIYDIQYTENISGNSPVANKWIKTQGIITAIGTSDFCIQDKPGKWNGITVTSNENNDLSLGDEISLYGYVNETNNITSIQNAFDIQVIAENKAIPDAVEIDLIDFEEAYESVLVMVNNLTCTALPDNDGEWSVSDNNKELTITNKYISFTPTINQKYETITGVAIYTSEESKLAPRLIDDFIITDITHPANTELFIYPNPAYNKIVIPNVSKNSNIVIRNLAGQTIHEARSSDNTVEINCSNLNSGVYVISLYSDNHTQTGKLIIKR